MKLVQGFETWSELDILTGTIFGEARGEPTDGKIGVGLTVKTRVEHPGWWGRNWREVCLADRQFSCWADHNKDAIVEARNINSKLWKICRSVAVDIYLGIVTNGLGKPTHYHATSVAPQWTKRLVRLAQIGNHIFYHDPSIDKA